MLPSSARSYAPLWWHLFMMSRGYWGNLWEYIFDIHPDIKYRRMSDENPIGISRRHPSEFEGASLFWDYQKKSPLPRQKIRILFLKIFDRSHNMITIDAMGTVEENREWQKKQLIYIPLQSDPRPAWDVSLFAWTTLESTLSPKNGLQRRTLSPTDINLW